MLKKLAGVVVALLLFFLLVMVLAGRGLFGSLDRGTLAEWPRPEDSVKATSPSSLRIGQSKSEGHVTLLVEDRPVEDRQLRVAGIREQRRR